MYLMRRHKIKALIAKRDKAYKSGKNELYKSLRNQVSIERKKAIKAYLDETICRIQFLVGVWKRALMSDFYLFADGGIFKSDVFYTCLLDHIPEYESYATNRIV